MPPSPILPSAAALLVACSALVPCVVLAQALPGDVGRREAPAVEEAERARPDEPTWQVALSPTYSSGTYGAGAQTNITYVPLSLQRLFRDGDLALVIPYVRVTGDGSVTLLSGVPNRRSQSGTGARTTEQGLGDLVLRARYYLFDEKGWAPTVAVTGRLKIPTADASKGLGTGKPDEGVGIELSKQLTDRWAIYLDGGYTVIGRPAGFTLQNQWNYDVGIGYNLTKRLTASLYYEEFLSVVPGFQNPQDLLITLGYAVTDAVGLSLTTDFGLSDGSPAYALTAGVSGKF